MIKKIQISSIKLENKFDKIALFSNYSTEMAGESEGLVVLWLTYFFHQAIVCNFLELVCFIYIQ